LHAVADVEEGIPCARHGNHQTGAVRSTSTARTGPRESYSNVILGLASSPRLALDGSLNV
jgi:hypothetical protein